METLKNYVGKKELRVFEIGALGQGLIYATMSSYISDFYLNILQVTPIFVMFLMFFARIWDAFVDPVVGTIIDRASPKHGKMRPYLLLTPIPIAFLTFLLFYVPDISLTAKMVYAGITYTIWGTIYSWSDVPFWSLPNIMTPNPEERGQVFSKIKITNGVGSALPIAIFMLLGFILPGITGRSGLSLEKTKYIIIALIASVIGNLLFIRVYFHVKERVVVPYKKREGNEAGAFKLLLTCKPLMLVILSCILSFGRYMFQVGAIHVARYSFYVGPSLTGLSGIAKEAALQKSISTVNTIFAVATAVGMFGTMLFLPKLIKKFNYKQLLISSCFLGVASCLITYFIGYKNFWACLPFFLISCIPAGVINVVSSAMIGDSLDYMEWKTGRRETALGSSCQSFSNKFGSAIATTSVVLMYVVFKLNVSSMGAQYTVDPTALSGSLRGGVFLIVSIIPAVSFLLCALPIFFYDLTGKKKQIITDELQQQRAAKGISVE